MPPTAKGASTSSEELNAQMSPLTDEEHNLLLMKTVGKSTTGEDHLWESKIYIHFQPQKPASNKSNNLICRPDSARKLKMRKMLF